MLVSPAETPVVVAIRADYVPRAVTEASERFSVPSLGGVSLSAIHRGQRSLPLLVLLHGGGANAHWWDHIAPELARRHHVVALDFRGHGASDHPEELKVGAFSDDLDALLEWLGATDPILVGHSLGGHVAFERAARVPGVRGLVLLDIAWGTPKRMRRLTRRVLSAARRSYATREEAVARYTFVPPAPLASESLRLAIAERSVRQRADGRFDYAFDRRWFNLPARPAPPLARVACPTLVIRGSESPMLTREGAAELVAGMPAARLVEIKGAAHHAHLDRPAEVLAALCDFLGTSRHRGPA